jgi:hypothetical protein
LLYFLQVEAHPQKPAAVTALGTLQNLAAESNANKEAIREAGGIPVLIGLIRDCPDTLVRPHLGSALLQQETAGTTCLPYIPCRKEMNVKGMKRS